MRSGSEQATVMAPAMGRRRAVNMNKVADEPFYPFEYPFYGPDFAVAEVQGIEDFMQKAHSLDYTSLLSLLHAEQACHEGYRETWNMATEFVFQNTSRPFYDLTRDTSTALAAYSIDTSYLLWREFNRECRDAVVGAWAKFPFKSLLSLIVEAFWQLPQPNSLQRALFRMQQSVDLRHEGDFYPLRQFTTAHFSVNRRPRRDRSTLIFQDVDPSVVRPAVWYPGFRTFDVILHPRCVFYVRRIERGPYGMPNVVLEFFK